jgi:hypothetical protein
MSWLGDNLIDTGILPLHLPFDRRRRTIQGQPRHEIQADARPPQSGVVLSARRTIAQGADLLELGFLWTSYSGQDDECVTGGFPT